MSDTTGSTSSAAVARLRRRHAENGSGAGTGSVTSQSSRSGSAAGMMKMYSSDTTGLKVDPIVVLVLSLIFIASVFVLHIWGKYTRSA